MTKRTLAAAIGAVLVLPAIAFAEVGGGEREAGMTFNDAPSSITGDQVRDALKKVDAPKAYHAGGRHDQRLHEAAVRARANGQTMERASMHAGGRHDERSHEAAIRADEKRTTGGDVR